MSRLCLVLAVVATAGLVAVPAVSAKSQTAKEKAIVKKLNDRIDKLRDIAVTLGQQNGAQDADANTLKGRVDTLEASYNAAIPVVSGALTALQAGLISAGDGLTQLKAALENSTTGLVGLNLARPQFGAFNAAGVIQGGTGQVTGASGPKTNATKGGSVPDIDGLYVVDFGNDVSKRMYTVNVFPYVPASIGGGGTTPGGSAVNCAASVLVSGVCGAVAGVASDSSPNHVLVQIGDGSSSGAANGFSVTAVSG
jgi:hypothetical protein